MAAAIVGILFLGLLAIGMSIHFIRRRLNARRRDDAVHFGPHLDYALADAQRKPVDPGRHRDDATDSGSTHGDGHDDDGH